MKNVHYSDSAYPLRTDFGESHSRYWQRLQNTGTWFNASQRIAIALASRDAHRCPLCQQRAEALSPHTMDGQHLDTSELTPTVIEAIHAIVTDASRLTQSWYHGLLEKGLKEGEYIEIVGTVVSMVSIDSFALAIGVAQRSLPPAESASADEPSYYQPKTATSSDQAWVPMLSEYNAGTAEADLWPDGKTGNVVRAMSLVPDEVRTLKDLSDVHYLEMPKVRQAGVDAGRALNRSQMELVAGRVSALNACYY